MPNLLLKHNSFIYSTDLEPDDIASIMIFLLQINKQAKDVLSPLKIAFLVGEGNSAVKVARMHKILDKFRQLGLLDNVDTSVIQGYSDHYSAQKNFTADGKDMLADSEIEQAIKSLPDGQKPETRQQACHSVKTFLADNSNSMIISVKPMRELQDLFNDDATVFSKHTLACTGSYNFRTICWSNNKETESKLQVNLLKLCNSFAESFIYETFSTTESNSTSSQNAQAFFNLMDQSTNDELLGSLCVFIENWKIHLLSEDRRKLPELLHKLDGILSKEQQAAFIDTLNKNYEEAEWKTLRALVEDGQKKYADNKHPLDAFQSLGRLLGKWKNLTQAPKQIVNADPGLLAALTGQCDENLSIQSAKMTFQGSYTALSLPDEQTRTRIYLPGNNTTLASYLEWRNQAAESKSKPVLLQSAQDGLLACINRAITNAAMTVHDLSIRCRARKETEINTARLVAESQASSLYRKTESELPVSVETKKLTM